MTDPLAAPIFVHRRRVEFADTDVGGIVHFSRFLVFMETAEHEMLRGRGLSVHLEDGGRTIGWEIADQAVEAGVQLDRIVVQVGGGAFAACVGAGLGNEVRLDTVQAAGCAPLADTWARVADLDRPERYWPLVMRPWSDPHSAADGILDDETYDWIADVRAMVESGGEPIVAPEADILRANELARHAGYSASHTGSAGLAGVLTARPGIHDGDRIAVVMSGVAR